MPAEGIRQMKRATWLERIWQEVASQLTPFFVLRAAYLDLLSRLEKLERAQPSTPTLPEPQHEARTPKMTSILAGRGWRNLKRSAESLTVPQPSDSVASLEKRVAQEGGKV